MPRRPGRWGGRLLLLAVTAATLGAMLTGFEAYLRRSDPFLTRLPFDSVHYRLNATYYRDVVPPEGKYTWGHRVHDNSLGFREREIAAPKPPGVCRIMVLGDSFTWGAGLAVDERYTGVADRLLKETFPDRNVEVLSFGVGGAPTVDERRVLDTHASRVEPDLVVVGFVFNDPQPKVQTWSIESERFEQRYGRTLERLARGMARIGLGRTAYELRKAIGGLTVRVGVVPRWEVALDRAYLPTSPEWTNFEEALRSIARTSDERGLPRPLFAALNPLPKDMGYRMPGESMPVYVRWHRQAERAAAAAGFRTYNHEPELERIPKADLFLNEIDRHPSGRVHQIYGRKLFEMVRADIDAGRVCRSDGGR